MWYKKEEQGRRVSWFYVCNSLTSIVGGFLAYGVSFAHTKFASWRIFFVAIGAATMCIGALVCIFLPDSPVKARRFTDAEKVAALLRTKNNQRYFFQTPECPFALANLRSGTQNAHLKKEQVGIVNP
jgi:MFS family permease